MARAALAWLSRTGRLDRRCRFDVDDKYLISVREAWNNGIQEAFLSLPKFAWETPPAAQGPTAVEEGCENAQPVAATPDPLAVSNP